MIDIRLHSTRLFTVFNNVTTLPDVNPDSLSPQNGTGRLFDHDSSNKLKRAACKSV
jgi:hypothetical protein